MAEAVAKIIITGKDDASGAINKVNQSLDNLGKSAKKNQSSVKDFFKELSPVNFSAGAATLAGAALAMIGKKALDAASQLETLNRRAQSVYGTAFPSMSAEAERLGAALGRSGDDVLGLATDFASMEKSVGLSSTAIQSMSTNLAHLTVDIASAKGISEAEVFGALQQGLNGSTRGLKNLQISMEDNALAAYAASKGWKGNINDMSEARQMAIRYNYILDHTKDLQGDATKSAASFSNQLQRLQGAWNDVLQAVGKPALGIAAGVLSLIAGAAKLVADSVNAAANAFGRLNSAMGGIFSKGFKNALDVMPGGGALKTIGLLSSYGKGPAVDYSGGINPLGESNAGGGGGGASKAAESMQKIKDGLRDVAKTYNEKVRDIKASIADLDASHREKMGDLVDQMKQVREEASKMADDYNKALGRMNDSEADSVAKQTQKVADLNDEIARRSAGNEGFVNGMLLNVLGNRSKDNTGKKLTYSEEKEYNLTSDQTSLTNLVIERDREKAALAAYTPTAGANIDLKAATDRLNGSAFTNDMAKSREDRAELEKSHTREMKDLADKGSKIQDNMRKETEAHKNAREQYALTLVSLASFKTDFIKAMNDVGGTSDTVLKTLKENLEGIKTTIESIDAFMAAHPEAANGTLTSAVNDRRAGRVNTNLPTDIPKFADGGIVTKPTIALIGEAGPEAVVPLNKKGGMTGGSNISMVFNIAKEVDADSVIRQITRILQKQSLASL